MKRLNKRAFLDTIGFHFEHQGRRHAEQEAMAFTPKRFLMAAAGRQSGKTIFAAACRAMVDLFWGLRAWWVVPSLSVQQEGAYWVRVFARRLAQKTGFRITSKQTPHLHFTGPTGGLLEFRTTGKDPKGAILVGAKLDDLIVEESSRIPDLCRLWEEQLRPTLTINHGRACFIGSPRGKRNEFFTLFEEAQQHPDSWEVRHFSSYANPFQDPCELQRMEQEARSQALIRQELHAEFIEEYGAFFPHLPLMEPALPLRRSFWGWDYAMGGICAFVKVVEDAQHRLIAVEEKAGPFPWEKQIEIAKQLANRGDQIVMDPHLQAPFQMDLARNGIAWRMGTSDRRESLEILRSQLNLDHAGLVSQQATPYLYKELSEAQTDPLDCDDMEKDTPDHAMDAFRYAFFYLWPGTRVFHQAPPRKKGLFEESWERMKGVSA